MIKMVTRVLAALALSLTATFTPVPVVAQTPCCLDKGLLIADDYRVGGFDERRFTHAQLWAALDPIMEKGGFGVVEIGRSLQGRAINAVTIGAGPTVVLLWSQMHGNESTATMALVDILNWFATGPADDPVKRLLLDSLTVVMVPMLNPDGAEIFVRENALGVDVNRDARRQATPEGRALKRLRDSLEADFGFNLHDQGSRTAGPDGDLVAIALLAPAADEERSWGPTRLRARQVAAVIVATLADEIPGKMAQYDDTFTPRAFGDLMQQWGTSTVLIESGAIRDDPQKQRLRAGNVAALISAFHAIATGSFRDVDIMFYDTLPFNHRVPNDILLVGGRVVLGQGPPVEADLAIVFDDAVAKTGPRYGEIGDLGDASALDTVDVSGLFIHPLADGQPAERVVRGAEAIFVVRTGPGARADAVWKMGDSLATAGQ